MIIGEVKTFPSVYADKEQALKIVEEAAEVFGAWQSWYYDMPSTNNTYETNPKVRSIIDECSDVIMATSNLLASLGIEDMSYVMMKCEQRNRDRGRYDIQE